MVISVVVFQNETRKLAELRRTTPIDVEIIRVTCERKKYIVVFNWKGKEYHKSLHHNSPACEQLKNERYVQIKVGPKGKIIFANEIYNGALDRVIFVKVVLGFLIGMALIYYLVYPHKEY